jgi:hypothetical protein
MNHRKFLVNSGFVGAGLLGAGKPRQVCSLMDPGRIPNRISIWRTNPWHSLCPHCRTRSTR